MTVSIHIRKKLLRTDTNGVCKKFYVYGTVHNNFVNTDTDEYRQRSAASMDTRHCKAMYIKLICRQHFKKKIISTCYL